MLHNRSVKPLVLELKPSRTLLVIYISLFVISLTTIIFLISAHLLIKLFIMIVLSTYLYYLLRKPIEGYLSVYDTVLTFYQNNICYIEMLGKNIISKRLKLLEDSWVSGIVIIMHFKESNGRNFYILVFADCLNADAYRKLRVHLNQARFAESEMAEE